MAKPLEFTDANFEEEVLKSDKPVLVDFWAEWCGPCKIIAPAIEELANEYEGKVKVGKVDVDSNMQAAGANNIRSIPTLLIFKDGQVADMIIGAVPKNEIKSRLDRILQAA
ncbi:MAG: thioredoxin [Calditrichaeota bacterium]|nr:MAG: thioredoxin [Calditrichota bacterium]